MLLIQHPFPRKLVEFGLEDTLRHLGEDGWELVCSFPYGEENTIEPLLLFKRAVEDG